jgi:hypothetical protein
LAILVCFRIDQAFFVEWTVILLLLGTFGITIACNVLFWCCFDLPPSAWTICSCMVLNVTMIITGGWSLANLASLLDHPYTSCVSYNDLLVPLIVFYSVLLAM